MKRALLISVAAGILCGLVCTFPKELGATPSFILWAIGGILVGFFARIKIIWPGALYGVVLSFVFLFSRFGGTRDHIPKYLLFVLAMSIIGAIGGILTVFLGSRLKAATHKAP